MTRFLRPAAVLALLSLMLTGFLVAMPQPAEAAPRSYTTTANLHVRAKPTVKSKSHGVLKKGTTVKSHGTKGKWHKITYKGKTRWTSGKFLKPVKKSTIGKGKPVKSKKKKKKVTKSKKKHVVKKKTKKVTGNSKYAIARRAANANGCASAKIVFDSRTLRGHLGTADWYNNTIHVASRNSKKKLPSVVVHECAHLKQYRAYNGNIKALARDMNRVHGTKGWRGLELNADCMARYRGYKHTYYSSRNCTGKKRTAAINTYNERRTR